MNKAPTLSKNTSGYTNSKRLLQWGLAINGFYPGDFSGAFGNDTYQAVYDFQNFMCLGADGIAGKNTWAALLSARGNTSRKATAFDTSTRLTLATAAAMKEAGYVDVGRYLTNTPGGTLDKKLTQEELEKNVQKYSVYARVSPEHKVRIVNDWKSHDEFVAMTGDGVNDAPALKSADIGAAMGIVGTDVAKEAADVVLTDDNFATIVSAVEEGRRIYDNILKAVAYLLSANIGEIITLFVATMFGWLIEPLLPIHILWINLVTDSLPALALSVDPAEKNIMNRKPKKNKNVFTKGMIWRIIYQGIMIGGLTLLAFALGCGFDFNSIVDAEGNITQIGVTAQTMAFAVLALSELVHVFNLRSNKESIFKVGLLTNKILLGAIAISASLMLIVLNIPALHGIFEISKLTLGEVGIVTLLSFAPLIVVEIFKLLKINTSKEENEE